MRGDRRALAPRLQAIEDMLGRLAVAAYRRPWRALAVASLLTVGAWFGAQHLRIEPSLTELLPEHYASVRQTRELSRRLGGVGYVAVVAENAPPEALEGLADALAPRLAALPSIHYVESGPSTAFFEEHALYYLPEADLRQLDEQLRDRLEWEKLHKNPLYVDLDDEGPPPIEVAALRDALGGAQAPRDGSYYIDPKARRLVLLAKPTQLASDMRFSRRVTDEVQQVLNQVDRTAYPPGLRLTLSGRYQKKVDLQDVVQADLGMASMLSLGLVLGYLLLHFRRPSALLQLLLPLLLGVSWTYGLAGWLFGTLNILTAFVGVILLGLGNDNGIHFLSRYLDERRGGAAPTDAVRAACGTTGRAALAATLTTLVSFASLMVSDFRGFRELGALAGGGLLLMLLSYVLVWPALEALLPVQLQPEREGRVPNAVGALLGAAPWVFWGGLVAVFAITLDAHHVRFDDDFGALEPRELPAYRLDSEVNRLLGRSQTPLVFLTVDRAATSRVAAAVRERARLLGARSGVDRVLSLADLVPEPHDQTRIQPILRSLAEKLDAIPTDSLESAARVELARLRAMTQARPFGSADLPEPVRRAFEAKGGALTELVLVFPRVSMSDGAAVRALAHELSGVPSGDGSLLDAAGEPMVLSDVLDAVTAQTPLTSLLALLAVGTVLLFTLGSLRLMLLAGIPALGSLAMTLGLMPSLGLDLNYLNVILLPVLIGLGVDGSAHLLVHLEQGAPLPVASWQVGRAVAGTQITNALGFAALLPAAHPGLRSLAHVAILGLTTNLLATTLMLPAFLALFPRSVASSPPERPQEGGLGAGLAAQLTLAGRLATAIATCLHAGHARWAPGSLGALLAVPVAWLIHGLDPVARGLCVVALTFVCTLAVQRHLNGRTHDPREVVVDEWIGCLISLAFVPFSIGWVVAGYLTFRALDILKPGPIGWLDRRLAGSLGVMADDVTAGLGAGALLNLLNRLVPG